MSRVSVNQTETRDVAKMVAPNFPYLKLKVVGSGAVNYYRIIASEPNKMVVETTQGPPVGARVIAEFHSAMGGQLARATAEVVAIKKRTIEIRLLGEPVFLDPSQPRTLVRSGNC
ncbi:MAG: hypothetical protein HYY84_10050 [Deltaproteobacteria bacterium]|nr:hypothetical protein [Deltaproteobacteria bacterium]